LYRIAAKVLFSMAAPSSAPVPSPKRNGELKLFPIILFAISLCGLIGTKAWETREYMYKWQPMRQGKTVSSQSSQNGTEPHPSFIVGEPVIADARIGITVALLGASLFVILAKQYTPTDKHWAYTTVGALIGYWFKG